MTAQVMVFFMAGFDTISTTLSFCCYELALNPVIQEKLHQEIVNTQCRNNNKLNYDIIKHMTYLDMVISESLRKWPPALLVGRCCTQAHKIPPLRDNEVEVHLNAVLISVFGIHRDDQIYPDPDCFDPERFTEVNKKSRCPYSYLPFGLGPRNCIAARFALMEMKTMLVQLLINFEIVTTDKTQIPLKIGKTHMSLSSEK
ncbi:probable cytochrome P450 6a13, partial [Atheta coriaria]|uniref:probable cytochrome P450 6a13 n=1 Tax=Dalotia coriaria TaxID=877792 RepID=UPI0031F3EE9F